MIENLALELYLDPVAFAPAQELFSLRLVEEPVDQDVLLVLSGDQHQTRPPQLDDGCYLIPRDLVTADQGLAVQAFIAKDYRQWKIEKDDHREKCSKDSKNDGNRARGIHEPCQDCHSGQQRRGDEGEGDPHQRFLDSQRLAFLSLSLWSWPGRRGP